MSIHTITIDEFAMLTLAQHQHALALYDHEIEYLLFFELSPEALAHGDVPEGYVARCEEKLENYQKLREVHHARIDELTAEATATDGSTPAIAA